MQRFYQKPAPLLLVLLYCLPLAALAAGGGSEPAPGPRYIELKPPFVVNVGEPSLDLSYAKVSVTLKVNSEQVGERVQHHAPWLKNELVFLLSGQPMEQITDAGYQEKLRAEGLDRVNEVLAREEGEEVKVEELLFTDFIVQR